MAQHKLFLFSHILWLIFFSLLSGKLLFSLVWEEWVLYEIIKTKVTLTTCGILGSTFWCAGYLAQLANQNPILLQSFLWPKGPMLATFGKCKLCDSKLVILYSWICCVNLCNFQSHWRCWKCSPFIVHPVMVPHPQVAQTLKEFVGLWIYKRMYDNKQNTS